MENVRALGKKVYVATWGNDSLAPRLRRAAFDHIDLRDGLERWKYAGQRASVIETVVVRTTEIQVPVEGEAAASAPAPTADATAVGSDAYTPEATRQAFLHELDRAELQFAGGYVGASFFINRWRSDALEPTPQIRQRLLDALVRDGLVDVYEAADGSKALRRLGE